eukprot:2323511-Prymnesium_polylepis.1
MGTATPDASRREDNIDFYWPTPFNDNTQSNHAIRYTGTLYIEQPGQYAFYIYVDDGFQLWVDNHLLRQRAGCLNSAPVEFRVEKQLEAGPHRLELYYYNCDGPERVRLSYECTLLGLTKRTIPPHAFVPATVNSLTAQYYDMVGQTHTSIPDLATLVPTDTRKESNIIYPKSAGWGGPALTRGPHWAVKWTGRIFIPFYTDYEFFIESEGAAR